MDVLKKDEFVRHKKTILTNFEIRISKFEFVSPA